MGNMGKEVGGARSKVTTSSVKHGGSSVIAWACMAANGTASLQFIDVVCYIPKEFPRD